jgi:hypothetical protein
LVYTVYGYIRDSIVKIIDNIIDNIIIFIAVIVFIIIIHMPDDKDFVPYD